MSRWLWALVLASCKAKEPQCHEWLAPSAFTHEQYEALRRKDACDKLGHQALTISAGRVMLDGLVVSTDVPSGTAREIPPLKHALQRDRNTWEETHPDGDFPGKLDVTFDESTDPVIGESLFYSASLGGYSRLHVSIGKEQLDFAHPLPLPSLHDDFDLRVLFVTLQANGTLDIRFEEWLGPADKPKLPEHVALPDVTATVGWIASRCTPFTSGALMGHCIHEIQIETTDRKLVTAVRTVRALLQAPTFGSDPPRVWFVAPGLIRTKPS